jgi:hypothetical protein
LFSSLIGSSLGSPRFHTKSWRSPSSSLFIKGWSRTSLALGLRDSVSDVNTNREQRTENKNNGEQWRTMESY